MSVTQDGSVGAWEKALSTLPKDDLKPAETVLRKQYESCMNSAREAKMKVNPAGNLVPVPMMPGSQSPTELPWIKAAEMQPALAQSLDGDSSVCLSFPNHR